jgi:mannosyl-3-phosphoglycerate phosphatase
MNIIFTNLDGTLLDQDTYSFEKAADTLSKLNRNDIPVVICSGKNRREIESWREKLSNTHPFISENGGGIFIPKEYFPFKILYQQQSKKYFIIKLGSNEGIIHGVMNNLSKRFTIQSFLDMTEEEIAKDANLPLSQAKLAKKREYSIPFKILDYTQKNDILREIENHNLRYIIGKRYYHLNSNTDKGQATKTLIYLFKKKYEKLVTVGIGNSENDFSMLDAVDKPYVVRKKNGTYASKKYDRAKSKGPEGWKEVVEKELKL